MKGINNMSAISIGLFLILWSLIVAPTGQPVRLVRYYRSRLWTMFLETKTGQVKYLVDEGKWYYTSSY